MFKASLIYKLTATNKERWCNSGVVPQVPLCNFLGLWMTIHAEDPCTEDWVFCAIFRCGKAQMWRFLRSWDSNFVESNMILCFISVLISSAYFGDYSPWVRLENNWIWGSRSSHMAEKFISDFTGSGALHYLLDLQSQCINYTYIVWPLFLNCTQSCWIKMQCDFWLILCLALHRFLF